MATINQTMTKTKWTLDPAHSEITFKVRHMMITNVTGYLTDYTIEAETEDEDFSKAEVTFIGKLTSIDTGNAERDAHLRSEDFFEVQKSPEVIFKSTGLSKTGESIKLKGNITIKGTTKPITFDVEFGGVGKDPWGNTKAGFSVFGKLNRKDFGLNWNAALETGGVLVSDEVRIQGEIQLVKS